MTTMKKDKASRILAVALLLMASISAHSITFASRYGCDTLFHVGSYQQLEQVQKLILQRLQEASQHPGSQEEAAMHALACEGMMALGQYQAALLSAQQSASLYEKLLSTPSGKADLQLRYDYALVQADVAQLKTALMIDPIETIECYETAILEMKEWLKLIAAADAATITEQEKRLMYMEIFVHKALSMINLLGHDYVASAEECDTMLLKLKEQYPETATSSFDYIEVQLALSNIYGRAENFETSIQYAQQAMTTIGQNYGKENRLYATALHQLGAAYYQLNDLQSAADYLMSCIDIYTNTGHAVHADFAEVLEEAANICLNVREFKTAEDFYAMAKDVILTSCGEDCLHAYINQFLSVYPMMLRGEYQKATDQLRDVMQQETFHTNFSSDHLIAAFHCYFDIALMKQSYNDIFDEEETVEGLIQMFGNVGHSTVNNTYTSIGRAYQRTGKYLEACRPYSKALERSRIMAHQNFSFLPEEQRILYWERDRTRFESILRLNTTAGNDGLNDLAKILFDASLLQKSLLLNASVNMAHIIETKAPDELKQKTRKLQLMMSSKYDSEEQKKAECRQLEQEIQEEARQYGDFMEFANYTWQDVKRALKENEVAIEFVSADWMSNIHISAEILRSDMDAPCHLHLFSYGAEAQPEEIAEKFQTAVQEKLMKNLKPGEHIYFAPAGELHKMPIEYMQVSNGKRMDELYQMHRVTSTRQLISKKSAGSKKNIALFGGLNYNSSLDDMELQAMLATEQSRSKDKSSGVALWSYLPGTMKEVIAIAPMMESASYQVSLFTQDEGVEEQLKALSESHTSIIHIATHGYYQPSAAQSLDDSGLIFAGANNFWSNQQERPKSNVDDGVLTASEISNLNLIGTDLVVLSACQTALGEISGEGVFGLQRAFKKAGVQSLLMSLWEVDDEATQVLMTAFYQNLLSGHSKHESLKLAQNKVRQGQFMRNGKSVSGSDPHFWAAFVLVD